MRLDYEFINQILTLFIESEQTTLTIDSLIELYEENDQ